jgi:hypothetical protein
MLLDSMHEMYQYHHGGEIYLCAGVCAVAMQAEMNAVRLCRSISSIGNRD